MSTWIYWAVLVVWALYILDRIGADEARRKKGKDDTPKGNGTPPTED